MANVKILFLIFAIIFICINAKPYEQNIFPGFGNISKCKELMNVDTLCQKCAKLTKSEVAYPMCCTDKEDAYRWCFKYINFGLQKRSVPHWVKKNLTREEQIIELKKHLSNEEVNEWIKEQELRKEKDELFRLNDYDILPDILTNAV